MDSFLHEVGRMICSSLVHQIDPLVVQPFLWVFCEFFFQYFFVGTTLNWQMSDIFYREPSGNFLIINKIFITNFVHIIFTSIFNFFNPNILPFSSFLSLKYILFYFVHRTCIPFSKIFNCFNCNPFVRIKCSFSCFQA